MYLPNTEMIDRYIKFILHKLVYRNIVMNDWSIHRFPIMWYNIVDNNGELIFFQNSKFFFQLCQTEEKKIF